jgi:O-antigen/teichoic acid export membrane protein
MPPAAQAQPMTAANSPKIRPVDFPRAESRLAARMGGMRARVLSGMGALLLAQGITVAIQLLSLPLFLHFWDTASYGKWLLLTAIPVYFSMSDAGLLTVAANKITMLYAAGDRDGADTVFQSALALVLLVVAALGVASAAVLAAIPASVLDFDGRLTLWIMILATLLALFLGLFDSAFRSHRDFARGVFFSNVSRLVEFVAMGGALLLDAHLSSAAAGLALGRVTCCIFTWDYCRRHFPDLHWSLRRAEPRELRTLLRPSLGSLAFTLGNALSLQAVTLLVGSLFGTIILAIFNTYRTLSRVVLQMTATLSHAVQPEFSRLFGNGQLPALQRLFRRAALAGALISVLTAAAMVPLAPWLLAWWTHGKVAYQAGLFEWFALATLIGGLGHVPRIFLMASNRHSRLGVLYLVVSCASLGIAFFLARWLGPNGAALALSVPEAVMFLFGLRFARALLDDLTARSSVEHAG